MEQGIQFILQGGALALLAYLIWWTTQTGAPKLFVSLTGIATAMQSTADRLESLEASVGELKAAVDELRKEREE